MVYRDPREFIKKKKPLNYDSLGLNSGKSSSNGGEVPPANPEEVSDLGSEPFDDSFSPDDMGGDGQASEPSIGEPVGASDDQGGQGADGSEENQGPSENDGGEKTGRIRQGVDRARQRAKDMAKQRAKEQLKKQLKKRAEKEMAKMAAKTAAKSGISALIGVVGWPVIIGILIVILIIGILILAMVILPSVNDGALDEAEAFAASGSIVSIAQAEVGVCEDPEDSNSGPRVDEYLAYAHLDAGEAWCAAFVSWVYGQAGYSSPLSGFVWYLITDRDVEYARTDDQNSSLWPPQPGDILVEGCVSGGIHTGIVETYDNGRVTSIEGNSGDCVSRNGPSDLVSNWCIFARLKNP